MFQHRSYFTRLLGHKKTRKNCQPLLQQYRIEVCSCAKLWQPWYVYRELSATVDSRRSNRPIRTSTMIFKAQRALFMFIFLYYNRTRISSSDNRITPSSTATSMDIFKDIYKISKLYVNFPLQDIFLETSNRRCILNIFMRDSKTIK